MIGSKGKESILKVVWMVHDAEEGDGDDGEMIHKTGLVRLWRSRGQQ